LALKTGIMDKVEVYFLVVIVRLGNWFDSDDKGGAFYSALSGQPRSVLQLTVNLEL